MKHLYLFPGLAASSKIFEHISLPKNEFEIHLLEWKNPITLDESIEDYAKRMCEDVKHKTPVLIGVSFGGILVQEMSKIIDVEKIIIVSSIKTHKELPTRLKVLRDTKAYKLFPTRIAENLEEYTKYFVGDFLKKRAKLYKKFLSVRNAEYMEWAIYNVLNWKQNEISENLVHIQGTDDHIFPSKHINNFIPVEKGTHEMILTKAKTISHIIYETLT